MLAERAAVEMHDITADLCIRTDFAHDAGIIAIGYKADILTVGLHGHDEPHFLRNRAHMRLGHATQWETQIIKLMLRRCKQEIALVACRISGAMQFCTCRSFNAAHIMARGKAICAQFAG